MTAPDSKRKKALVSACLIVKDEEKFLGGCLDSLRNLLDEVVIGDTGSTDKSMQVAREHGASIFEIPWKDNFAAARNSVIDRASSQWILSIDADEKLRSFSKASLFSALQNPSKWAFYSLIRHKKDWTRYWVLRIFRNDRRIRYRGRIHENIRKDLDRVLFSEKGEIGYLDMVIDHSGYDGNQVHKYWRNLPLIQDELRADPKNTNLIRHLGLIHYKLGRTSQAEKEWRKAIHIIVKKKAPEPVESLAFAYLTESLQNRGNTARKFLDTALKLFPENPQLYCLNARELMTEGRFAHAVPYLHRLLRWGENKDYDRAISYHPRIFDAYPRAYLAVCLLMLGRFEESRKFYDAALDTDPGNLKIERMLRPLIAVNSQTGMKYDSV